MDKHQNPGFQGVRSTPASRLKDQHIRKKYKLPDANESASNSSISKYTVQYRPPTSMPYKQITVLKMSHEKATMPKEALNNNCSERTTAFCMNNISQMSHSELRKMTVHSMIMAGRGKDNFKHQTETLNTNVEVTSGKSEQKTPDEDKTAPPVSHVADLDVLDLTEELQILNEKQSSENTYAERILFSRNTVDKIHEKNKSCDSETRDSIKVLKPLLPRNDYEPLRPSTTPRHQPLQLDFTTASREKIHKSSKNLASNGHKHNAKQRYVSTSTNAHPLIDKFQKAEGLLQLCKDGATINDLNTDNKENLKDLYVRKHCKEISKSPDIFLANGITTYSNSTVRLKRVEVGEKKMNGTHEKVIMNVGASGAGKTRLINTLFNQVVGVKWNDKVKLSLIDESGPEQPANQAKSQTDWVTAYTIHHDDCFTIPYTITVIDTPGFGDTSGIMRDNEIPKQLHEFFSTNGCNGIDHLDAVGFVIQSSLSRLTAMQTYIYDSILGLFGKDIKDNIFLMFTFADGQEPPAMSSVDEASLPYQNYYLFNNGGLYDTNVSVVSEAFWNMGVRSFRNFLKDLAKTEPRTICLTKDVLKFRYRQEKILQNIQRNMSLGLNTIEELQKEKQILIQHQIDIEKNRSFTYVATEQYVCETEVHDGFVAINCKACHITCYETVVKGRDREEFLAVCIDGCCPTCPERCDIAKHQAEQMSYVFKRRKVQRTSNFLKKSTKNHWERKWIRNEP